MGLSLRRLLEWLSHADSIANWIVRAMALSGVLGAVLATLVGFLKEDWPLAIVIGLAVVVLSLMGFAVAEDRKRRRAAGPVQLNRSPTLRGESPRIQSFLPPHVDPVPPLDSKEALRAVFFDSGQPVAVQARQLLTLYVNRMRGPGPWRNIHPDIQHNVLNPSVKAERELRELFEGTSKKDDIEQAFGRFVIAYERVILWIHVLGDCSGVEFDDSDEYRALIRRDTEFQAWLRHVAELRDLDDLIRKIVSGLRAEFTHGSVYRRELIGELGRQGC